MSESLDVIKSLLHLDSPVSFIEYVESPDYCDYPDLFNFWKENGEKVPENISELILDGSLGGGKSTFADYYFSYRVYLLFFYGSPQTQLGLPQNADIYCLYFSVSLTMAKKSGFQLLYDIFSTNKWFKAHAPIDTNLKSSIEFIGKHFHIDFASSFGHQIGLNVWGFILDEANFRNGVGFGVAEEYAEVTELYQQLQDRQLSRFAKPDGSVEALAVLISSASYQSSFLEKRKSAIKGNPNALCITSASYEVRPERFSKEKFQVFIGAGTVQPAIIESEEHKKKLLDLAGILGTGDEESFIRNVPVNLLSSFQTNIILALQNHCGVPTNMSSSFMSNLKFLYDSYVELPVVFQSEELVASNEDDTQLIEYCIPSNFEHPERPHSLFLDLSIQHDPGALVCYRYDGKDERGYDMHTRVFRLRIMPPPFPASTQINKVRQLIEDLSQIINIVAFASDQYQSAQLRQEVVASLGLEDIRVSVDSSDVPHLHWQRGLVEGRIRQTKDEVLEREVQEAVHDYKKHRVLKAAHSTDDTMQANVAAFFLSDTFGKSAGTLDGLYSDKVNLVGGKSISQVLKTLGYRS